MSRVRIETQLGEPPVLVFRALEEILREIAAQEGAWRGFPLHVDLGDAGLPNVGYVAIPIALEVTPGNAALQQLEVTFRAARSPEAFPAFHGEMGVDATGPTGAMLWIAGTYDLPGSIAGGAIDATLLRGVAQRTLKNFLDDVAAACRARIEKREAQYARYRIFDRA